MSASSRVSLRALLIAAAGAGILAGQAARADDVTYFDKAPTAEELRRQLMEAPAARPRTRGIVISPQGKPPATRGIVFDTPAQPAAAAAPAPAAAPAAASAAPQAQPAPQTSALAAPGAAPAAAQPAQLQVSEKAIAFPINFRLGQAQIQPDSLPFIDIVADFLEQNPNVRLLVEGHTDSTGNAERNMTLSRERAFSVSGYLIEKHHIDPSRLLAIGRGQSEPLPSLDPKNARNRRVQFRVIGG